MWLKWVGGEADSVQQRERDRVRGYAGNRRGDGAEGRAPGPAIVAGDQRAARESRDTEFSLAWVWIWWQLSAERRECAASTRARTPGGPAPARCSDGGERAAAGTIREDGGGSIGFAAGSNAGGTGIGVQAGHRRRARVCGAGDHQASGGPGGERTRIRSHREGG